MEDSLEDYIRIARNSKQEDPVDIRKEAHQISLQRKKQCDDQAFKIVEFSIEGKLRPDIFTRCLPYINQSHYQDITEERAITKLCGYPICGKRIPDMPKKQYYISTKTNKVYDITDRKNFCCNFCYKASVHIKKQIDDSPLWLRKYENIPEFKLLGSNEGGLPGEFVDQGMARPVVDSSFMPISSFAEVSLKDMQDREIGRDKSNKKEKSRGLHKKVTKLIKTMQTINENTEQLEEEEETVTIAKSEKPLSYNVERLTSALPVIIENEENVDLKSDSNNIKNNSEPPAKVHSRKPKKKSSKSSSKFDPEEIIKKVVKEWLTLETYVFIYGENKIKEILNEKKLSEYFDELKIADLQRDQQIKYMDICKRLHLQEMADQKFDEAIVNGSKLKPIPDFQKLKEESKDLRLKVKCFYGGVLYEKDDTNFPTKVNKDTSNNEEEPPAVLPLVDISSQKALRRKIFLSAVNKSMQNLLEALRVRNFTAVQSDLQGLVKTFRLQADNIVFKPVVWSYIAIILLNILSIRDPNLKSILEEPSSKEFISLQLSLLPGKGSFITDTMSNIQNIEMFVEHYISCN
nr:RNA polymerase II subunit B1 CTD phosphatase Rpap2 [Leptinotarsa decemlineata]